jgi:hypothetical protein
LQYNRDPQCHSHINLYGMVCLCRYRRGWRTRSGAPPTRSMR